MTIYSSRVTSLNPSLLQRPQAGSKGAGKGEQHPFNGDFTGFNDVRNSLVKQFERLDKCSPSSPAASKIEVFEGVKSVLVDALILPPRLREQVLKTFLEKCSKTFPTVASSVLHEAASSRQAESAPIDISPTVVDLARHLQDRLAPTGRRSPAISAMLAPEIQNRPIAESRWVQLNFKRMA